MSLEAMRSALTTAFVNSGDWSADEISACDAGIMTTSACCILLAPGNSTFVPKAFGTMDIGGGTRALNKFWEISGLLLIKDPGDPIDFLTKIWDGVDDLFDAITADETLGGVAETTTIAGIDRGDPDSYYNDGGVDWAFLNFRVVCQEV